MVSSFRFLHAADLHLDSPMRGLSRYEGVPHETVRGATRAALDGLVACSIENAVAFVVISGDLYDGDWRDIGTGLYFCGAMGRLNQAGIRVFLIHGNHDAESEMTRRLPLPTNVYVLGHRRAETVRLDDLRVAIHGQSFASGDTRDNLAVAYPPALGGWFNIGLLHTALTGRPPHAPYAPCTIPELAAKSYDYWALGHVHGFEVLSRDPWIVYPGNLQGRSIRETGPKGAVLVQVEDGRVADVSHVALDVVRWARVPVRLEGADAAAALEALMRQGLERALADEGAGRPLLVRLEIAATLDAPVLLARRQALRADAQGLAAGLSPDLWIEKVTLSVTRPEAPPAIGDDVAALFAQAAADPDLHAALAADIATLADQLPPQAVPEDGLLSLIRNGQAGDVLAEAAQALLARLSDGGGAA